MEYIIIKPIKYIGLIRKSTEELLWKALQAVFDVDLILKIKLLYIEGVNHYENVR